METRYRLAAQWVSKADGHRRGIDDVSIGVRMIDSPTRELTSSNIVAPSSRDVISIARCRPRPRP